MTMSVERSITMTAAVPRPDFTSRKAVEVHQDRVAGRLRQQRHGRAAGDDREQIVPTAAHAAGMFFDQLAQRNAHFLFHIAGPVRHVARDAEDFRAGVVRDGRGRRTTRRRGAGSSARRRSIPRCSPSSGSRRGRRLPGTAASGAACPSCLRGFRAAPFLHHRCKRRRRDGRSNRSPSRSPPHSCRTGRRRSIPRIAASMVWYSRRNSPRT